MTYNAIKSLMHLSMIKLFHVKHGIIYLVNHPIKTMKKSNQKWMSDCSFSLIV